MRRRLAELERRAASFQTVLDNIPVGVWLQDRHGRITYGNPTGLRIWAGGKYVGPQEFHEYKAWWVSTGKRVQAHEWAAARAIEKGETSLNEELEIERFDGVRRIILNSAVPVRGPDGEIEGSVIVNEDITERKRFEERLAERAALIDMATDAVTVRDFDGSIQVWNPAAEAIYGYSAAEALGRRQSDLLKSRFDAPAGEVEARVLAEGSYRGDVRQTRKDGREIVAEVHWRLLRDARGEPARILSIARDVTERRRLEGELKQSNERLRDSNEDLNAFAYAVAHDLRAPLRAINGFAQLARDGTEAVRAEAFERIVQATLRMSTLVDRLLLLASLNRAQPVVRRFDLAAQFRDLAAARQASEPGRRVEVVSPPSLPADGDPAMTRIMLENLLDNAWKATVRRPDARVELGASGNGRGRTFFIKDNGVGFQPERLHKLFTPFNRLHSPEEFPGQGLGLPLAVRAAQTTGGRVWAEGRPGEGAVFYFTLG